MTTSYSISPVHSSPGNLLPTVNKYRFDEEYDIARNMNRSIALAATAFIWATSISPAAAFQPSATSNASAAAVNKVTSVPAVLDARAALIGQLLAYTHLEPGWDGADDDVAPSFEAVYQASAYIERLPHFLPLPDVSVASDGEIIVFWRDQDTYVDVSFRGNQKVSFFARRNGEKLKGSSQFEDVFSSSDQLASFLIKVFAPDEMLV